MAAPLLDDNDPLAGGWWLLARWWCWDLRLEKLSKSLSKIMIAAEGVESKYSISLKHQE